MKSSFFGLLGVVMALLLCFAGAALACSSCMKARGAPELVQPLAGSTVAPATVVAGHETVAPTLIVVDVSPQSGEKNFIIYGKLPSRNTQPIYADKGASRQSPFT